ncbi:MAG: flagellar basal body L-ring protein FlgH [Fimbriimonadaceae bacterium]
MNLRTILASNLAAVAATSALAQAVNPDNPGSLWPSDYKNPVWDRTARSVGDVVTILISESSAATFQANVTTSRNENNQAPRINFPLIGGLLPAVGTSGSLSSAGTGSSGQAGRLTTRMTAIVKQVLPNGNLVVEGTRSIQVNKEVQTFRITGIVRRDDVRPDNTVLSENVGEASIRVDGRGAISDRTRRGILSRIIDWLF